MFCSKCGKEIDDEALVCPGCGCATANYQSQKKDSNSSTFSQDYLTIKDFEAKVQGVYGLSVVSLILFLGIGFIFSVIAWAKLKKIKIPEITTENPNEIAMFQAAKRKLRTAWNFTLIPLFPLCILGCLYTGFGLISLGESGGVSILLSIFAFLLLVVGPCAICSFCTKHLLRDDTEILKNKE